MDKGSMAKHEAINELERIRTKTPHSYHTPLPHPYEHPMRNTITNKQNPKRRRSDTYQEEKIFYSPKA
jgi:hypothetical protein